jgi:hypothetical protein
LIRIFYENLGKGLAKDEALRAAKLSLLHKGVGSRAWAGFVLHGDADSPVRAVLSWPQVTGIAAGLVGLCALYIRRRRLH